MIDPKSAHAIVGRALEKDRAFIDNNSITQKQTVQKISLTLTTAKSIDDPLIVNFPFKSILVSVSNDPSNVVYIRPQTNIAAQDYFPLSQKDSWTVDYPISRAFIHWAAQSGKTMELTVFTDSEFRSGSQISVNSGGVSINEGSSIAGPTRVTLLATTATIIAPANTSRKVCTIQNKTGAILYVGGSTIGAAGGATEGIAWPDQSIIQYRNTAALYGWSTAGGNIHYNEET